MAAKHAHNARGLGSYEALLLYLDVLHGQGKHTVALSVRTQAKCMSSRGRSHLSLQEVLKRKDRVNIVLG